jgi:hypothetical protein
LALALCAFGFAACSTYDDSMLVGTLNPNLPAGGAGTSGGLSHAGAGAGGSLVSAGTGAVGDGGGHEDAGAGGTVDGGDAGQSPGGYAGTVTGGASGSAGAGGAVITGGTAGVGNAAGAPSGSLELIDDFEDGDGVVIPIHGRNGPWYTFSDATVGGKLSPSPFAVSALGANAHDDSTAGVHLTASGFTDWGAGVGADLVNVAAKKVAYDVSAYKGVHFYAKIGTGASAGLKLLVTTTYSDPSGGICTDAMPYTVPSKRCSDHLYFPKTIKTTWATYDVLFADLIQQGFGLPQAKLDPKSVYSLQFTMPANLAAVDLWLDDVSFIVK